MPSEEIVKDLEEVQQFNAELREFLLNNFVVEDKTLTQWKRYFYVKIPDDINFLTIIKLTQEIAKKYQEAARLRDEFTVQLAILDQGKNSKYTNAYNNIRLEHERKYNKTLAADSCKVAATVAIHSLETAISHQKIVKEFWAETCRTLVEIRKHVEVMARALSGDSFTQRDLMFKTSQK